MKLKINMKINTLFIVFIHTRFSVELKTIIEIIRENGIKIKFDSDVLNSLIITKS